MKTITIIPENNRQFAVIEAFLKEMKICYKEGKAEEYVSLEDWQKRLLDERLKNLSAENTVSETDAHEAFDACFK